MHVDTVTFSFPELVFRSEGDVRVVLPNLLEGLKGDYLGIAERCDYDAVPQKPYKKILNTNFCDVCWTDGKAGVIVQIKGHHAHLWRSDDMMILCGRYKVTRIDIAHDLEQYPDLEDPEELIPLRDDEKHTYTTKNKKGFGKTCYLGSEQSDAYTYVYKYKRNESRPYVRVEHRFSRKVAANVAMLVSEGKMAEVYQERVKMLKLDKRAHVEVSGLKINLHPKRVLSEKQESKKSWFMRVALKALRYLYKSGAITLRELFDDECMEIASVEIANETKKKTKKQALSYKGGENEPDHAYKKLSGNIQ